LENKKSKIEQLRVRSDFVKDILEKTPTWFTTWGNLFFLLFIIVLILLAHFIEYPEVLTSNVEIITEIPPTSITLEKAGELDTLYIQDKTNVSKGQLVAKVRSVAEMEDLLILENKINSFPIDKLFKNYLKNSKNINLDDQSSLLSIYENTVKDFGFKKNDFPKGLNLGELANLYSQFNVEFDEVLQFIKQNITSLQINSMVKEIERIQLLNQSLKGQQEIFQNEFFLTTKNYERNKKLNENSVISDVEKESFEKEFYQQKRALENFETLQLSNELAIEEKRSAIKNYFTDGLKEYASRLHKIKESLRLLQSTINTWKKNHLVYAPIGGTISFNKQITEKQFFNSGEHICYVLPDEHSNKIIGVSEMPVGNSGNIGIGYPVKIRLDAFPYQEFGIIEGKIKDIALSPNQNKSGENFRKVIIELKNNELKTAYEKVIPFAQKYTGTALIIKEKRSILSRLLESLYSLIEN